MKNSARYMAPERFDFPERPGTKEADVWSFGMTVYVSNCIKPCLIISRKIFVGRR